jgi:cobalt-zinc-cadmium efflux system membrane fusion protein
MISIQWRPAAAAALSLLLLAGCGKAEEKGATSKPDNVASGAKRDGKTSSPPSQDKGLTLSREELAAAGIRVAPLQEQALQEQINVTATIQPNRDRLARIAPRVAGRVVKVMAKLGDTVKPGQALAEVDSIEVGEAQSAYAQAQSEHALAKASMDRAEKLLADQIIPQKDYLRARADYEKSTAILRAAAQRRQALGVAGRNPAAAAGGSLFSVSAPFAGTVIDKAAVLGELAQADKPLFSIADLSNVWIETNLYEKDLGKVQIGAPVVVTTAAYPDETFTGTVAYIASAMDKETRTARARVVVPNPAGRLKLDMFATASIATRGARNAFLLAQDAVVLVQGQPTVFIQEQGGFSPRAVELGEKLRDHVVLKAGVKPGEQVVTSGAFALKAKMLKSQISSD